ncbi:NAD(P)-binding protein [Exidia glandulosa HHB12029]|uniref:NAD(P)-binding protein n=1 Tax=Exidia glandulosa HHB12029 TaxID=1314781 RepID=A0A165KG46_EXIGL|nr:NAD(P)-binding protein [Exidia glandulosa HHB12029]
MCACLKKYGAGNGAWAVVTGASGGIGREFALQLAKKGFNVALLGRSTSKLDTVSNELAALPGVKVSVTQHAIDLAGAKDEEWAALEKALSSLNIGVLVNNAGINRVAPYVAGDGKVQAEIVNVNVTAVLRLTSIVLPGMVARNRGLVVSTGSLNGGAAPMPLTTVYSGSKAFLVTWTQALGIELAKMKSAVDVAVINAGYVAGGMAVEAKPSFVTPDGERFVRAVLGRIGLPVGAIGRRFVWTPYWSHALLEFFVRSLGLETLAANATYAGSYPVTSAVVFLMGAYVLGNFSLKFVRMLLQLTVRRGTNLSKYGAGTGAWAVVTGATGGIGREFALQLAKKGFNVVLLGRTPSKLETVSKELATLPGVKVTTTQYTIDFASARDEEWAALEKALLPLDIGVLVNNAGISRIAPFAADDDKDQAEIVAVNVTAVLRLTSIVLPGMVARNRGLVLSIGSLSGGVAPIALSSVYSASKAFLVTWTQGLGDELARTRSAVGVAVINVGYVAGGMADGVDASFMTPNGERFVRAVLGRIGLAGGAIGRRFVWNPYWSHALLEFFVRSFGLETFAAGVMTDSLSKALEERAKTK